MTKHRFTVLLLAALTVLILCACGATTETSSAPEGLQTFGMAVDPSAQPSTGQTVSGDVTDNPNQPAASSGPVIEGNTPSSAAPHSPAPSSQAPAPSKAPSTPTPTTSPTATPTSSPIISPPAPASTATVDEAAAYVGQSLSELIEKLGYPSRSDYEDIDEEDPDAGKIGTLYFKDFTVTTKRDADGEVVTAVTPN